MPRKTEAVYTHSCNSPIGRLFFAVDRRGAVMYLGFAPADWGEQYKVEQNKYACGELALQLEEYFSGRRERFTLALRYSGTPFQESVWSRLLKTPYGQTVTYGQIAQKIGQRSAARAVGNAVAVNPISLLIPCHRVLPASGGIGTYAARSAHAEVGARQKAWLLNLEGAHKTRLERRTRDKPEAPRVSASA